MAKREPMFKGPLGESKFFDGFSSNTHRGTISELDCEFCGTNHPELTEREEDRHTFVLLGREGVLECCGKILDLVYREWGGEFTSMRLKEFKEAPLDQRYGVLHIEIGEAVKGWKRAAEKAAIQASEVAAALP